MGVSRRHFNASGRAHSDFDLGGVTGAGQMFIGLVEHYENAFA